MKKRTVLKIYAGIMLSAMTILLVNSCTNRKVSVSEEDFQAHYIKKLTNPKHADIYNNWAFHHEKPAVEPSSAVVSKQAETVANNPSEQNEVVVASIHPADKDKQVYTKAPQLKSEVVTTASTPMNTTEFSKKQQREIKKDVKRQVLAAKKEAKKYKSPGQKSWLVAVLLCFFLGALGIHRFYLGYTGIGVIQLLTAGGCGIWVLIDFIRLLVGDLGPADGSTMDTDI